MTQQVTSATRIEAALTICMVPLRDNGTYMACSGHAVSVDDRFETAEAAALSGWTHTPSARARVVEVQQRTDDEVVVVIEVDGNTAYNRDLVTCQRDAAGWRWTGSTGSGS